MPLVLSVTHVKLTFAIGASLMTATTFAAGSVVIDNTLPGHPTTTTISLTGGKYTIPSSQGFVSGPMAATHNLFLSFLTFNVDTNETAAFINDRAATYASDSFNNIVSRVTGGA